MVNSWPARDRITLTPRPNRRQIVPKSWSKSWPARGQIVAKWSKSEHAGALGGARTRDGGGGGGRAVTGSGLGSMAWSNSSGITGQTPVQALVKSRSRKRQVMVKKNSNTGQTLVQTTVKHGRPAGRLRPGPSQAWASTRDRRAAAGGGG